MTQKSCEYDSKIFFKINQCLKCANYDPEKSECKYELAKGMIASSNMVLFMILMFNMIRWKGRNVMRKRKFYILIVITVYDLEQSIKNIPNF